ncbi:MAG TPA: hypothetical protein VK210_00125 [Terriglobia bacterium]|nr:hypothetical protein [Terriglobia bacterium]
MMRTLTGMLLILMAGNIALHYAEAQTGNVPAPARSGFNFELTYGSCRNELSTAKGSLSFSNGGRGGTRTIDLKLTSEEMALVGTGINSLDFWNDQRYPSIFSVKPAIPRGQGYSAVSPGRMYVLAVTAGARMKTLTWNDNIPNVYYEPAYRLKLLIEDIVLMIESKAEYKAVPHPVCYTL